MRPWAVGGKVRVIRVAIHHTGLLQLVDDLTPHHLPRVLRIIPAVRIPHEDQNLMNGAGRLGSLTPRVIFGEPGECQ